MTGLEKILQAIEADATAYADAVLSKAKLEADEIISSAKIEAEKKCSEITAKSERDCKSVISRAESSAQLQEKKVILDAKQQIISSVIANAKNSLINLPDADYFGKILQMVKKHTLAMSGAILFSEKDKKRLPKDFDQRLKDALSEKVGASLTISEQTRNLDGGFILVYGEIEVNCSFDALFSAAKDDLQDKVNALLFE